MNLTQKILIGIGVVLAVGLVYNAGERAGTETTTTTTRPPTTTTTVDNDRQECASRLDQQMDESQRLLTRSESTDFTDPVAVRSFIRDSRQFIAEGRGFVRDCGYFAPVEAAQYDRALDDMELAVDEAESLYNLYFS